MPRRSPAKDTVWASTKRGYYKEILNTDSELYGGSGVGNLGGVESTREGWHGEENSIQITIPPLATVAFELT